MPAVAGWTDLESRNRDAVRGFANLAAYQNILELPPAGPTQVSLRDIATIALSLGGMALLFCFPASQVLLVVLGAIIIGVRKMTGLGSQAQRRDVRDLPSPHSS